MGENKMKILIKHVNVFDGKHSALERGRNIIIDGSLVTEITKDQVSEEAFDQVIDGRDQYAIPGLTDAHVHLGKVHSKEAPRDYGIIISSLICKKLLDHGITTVRDAGGLTEGLKWAIDAGDIPGPRIYPSNAIISQTCGHGDNETSHANRDVQYRFPVSAVLADGPAEVMRAVREQLFRGASQIKIMGGGGLSSKYDPIQTLQFTPEEMKAAVDVAADYGTYVMAHLYTPECIKRAVRAGVKSLEHAHAMDDEAARMIRDTGTFLDPAPQFSDAEARWNRMGKYAVDPNWNKKKKRSVGVDVKDPAVIGAATELINKYDLKILFGTDMMIMYPEYEPRESLDLTEYKERFGSFKSLLAATGNINDLIKLTTYQNPYPEGEIGVLKKGAFADLLIVKGNPVENLDILGDIDNLLLVMKDGKVYKNTLDKEPAVIRES